MICVSIGRTRHKMVRLEHEALAQQGAELVELRLDWLARLPDLGRLLVDRPTPVVVTARRQADHGRWMGDEKQRQTLLRAAIVGGAEYVDLEVDIAHEIPRYGSTKRIVSHHDFDETPDDLEEIYARMLETDCDIIKLVTMANSPHDMVRMLKLVSTADRPTIGFCMGELGIPSRILCGKYGSPFTYAAFSSEREMAPGQISFAEMNSIYRFNQIRPKTRVFGVVGDPIAHSLSPLIHNQAFEHEEFDAVYIPFRVPEDQFADTLEAFEWLQVEGYSVTIPHKQSALAYAAERDEFATTIGAANTLYRDTTHAWHATNTDYDAALASIRLGLVQRGDAVDSLAGRTALILGAGGVARAVALGLVRAGADLTITNRSHKRAKALAEELGCHHTQWENRGSVSPNILVNCTAVGMHPNVEESPFPMNWLDEGMLVFDTVYNPENTLLLKEARQRGCHTVSGIEMFVRQAADQFECFTRRPAPQEVMRAAIRKGISPLR